MEKLLSMSAVERREGHRGPIMRSTCRPRTGQTVGGVRDIDHATPSRIVATLNPFSSLPWNNERIALFERLADLGILVLSTAHE